jgi:hypothetical protein
LRSCGWSWSGGAGSSGPVATAAPQAAIEEKEKSVVLFSWRNTITR